MERQKIIQIIKEIFFEIAPEIDFTSINPKKSLRDQVDIDSFDFYRVLVKISQRTGIILPESKVSEIRTLEELVNNITEQPNLHQ